LGWNDASPAPKERQTAGVMLFWDTAGKKLLVSDVFNKPLRTGIYDPATKQMRTVNGMVTAFGNSPVRPDGKGFLVLDNLEQPKAAFIDWEGKSQKIELPAETTDDGDKKGMLSYPWWFASRWEGDVASVAYKESRIRIDTKTFKASFEKRPAAEARVGTEIIQLQHQFASGVKVRALVTEKVEGKQEEKSRLEIMIRNGDKPRVIVDGGKGYFGFSPSPDKKLLAIWCVDDGTKNPRIYVVNSAGDIVSETIPKQD